MIAMVENISCSPAEANFVDSLLNHLPKDAGPVAIQAGHFLLVDNPANERCVPGVFQELEQDAQIDEAYLGVVRKRIGVFPLATWQLGACLAHTLRARGENASLFTVVNDWQYVPRSETLSATERRRQFYATYRKLLPSYRRVLRDHGLERDAIVQIGRHPVFVSENWLRRRLERHLEQVERDNGLGAEFLTWKRDQAGNRRLALNDPEETGCDLECGRITCAGEILELVYLVASKGFRTLVNFVPAECEKPVNEGTRRGIVVFHLAGLHVVNVSLSCAGEASLEEMLSRPRCLHLFRGISGPGREVRAEHRPIRKHVP